MFKFNLKFYFFTFKRFKTAFLINLIGLSAGLACGLLIYLWIYDEINFDKFHDNDARLHKAMVNEKGENGINSSDGTSSILGESMKNSFPEVEYTTATTPATWFRKFNLSFQNKAVKASGNFVSKDFFMVFSYKLIEGQRGTVLADKSSIVISETLAKKLFNTTDNIVGKLLEWKWSNLTKQYVITGIFENFPANSTYQYDCVLPLDSWETFVPRAADISGGPYNTFVVLKKGADIDQFNKKLSNYIKEKISNSTSNLFLTKYSDLHLYGNFENGIQSGGRIEYVKLFSIIAIFILFMACINFMNLSTAKTSERVKEIGIKKALGAERHTLIMQFLGEAIIMSFLSLIIAILLVILLLPQFNRISDKHLELAFNVELLISVFLITLITGVIAGSYPALYLSRFKPVLVLKGKFISSVNDFWIRKGLVFFQFTLSIVFIVSMMVIYSQIKFIQNRNMGYDKDNVICFEMEGRIAEKPETFFSEVKSIPGVVQASSIQSSIVLPTFSPAPGVYWEGKNMDDKILFYQMAVNYDLLETLSIKIARGRSFSRKFGADTNAIIINEAAVKIMGLSNPVGALVNVWGKDKYIVGVAENFHFNSLHEEIKPFIFSLDPKSTLLVMIKIRAANEVETINAIRKFYSSFNRGSSFDFNFLDDDYQAQYASEKLLGSLSRYFAILAIVISSLGLFGLASFTVQRRIREIGIRKTLGASELSIVYLLSADFTKIVLISIVIGLPLSYIITSNWLNNFIYRIDLSPWHFIVAALIALLTAWCTVGIQTVKASLANPIKYLKEE